MFYLKERMQIPFLKKRGTVRDMLKYFILSEQCTFEDCLIIKKQPYGL